MVLIGEMLRRPFGQEAPRHRLVEPARRRRPAQPALELLLRRGGRARDAFGARQSKAGYLVEPVDAHDFLDQIGRTFDVAATQRADHLPIGADAEAEACEDALLLVPSHIQPAETERQTGIECNHFGRRRRRTGAHGLARRAASKVHDQAGEQIEASVQKLGINPAFKPRARIRGQSQLAARRADAGGIEIGNFEQHVGGSFRHARMLAAHDPCNVVHLALVRDYHHFAVERVGLLVERQHLFAVLGAPRDHHARKLGEVIGVGRAAEAEHQVVGQIDQQRNRPLACALEPRPQPIGRGAVGYAGDDAAIEGGTAFRIVRADFDRTRAAGGEGGNGNRLQRPQPLRRQVAGDAVDAHAIGPVRGHRHLDHRIGAVIIGKTRPHRRVSGQFDDAVVILAQFELARGAHHAVRLDPADRALPQHHAVCRNHSAGKPKHALHPGPRIGRAANDLERLAVTGINREHLQLVGIGVARGGEHVSDAEARQLLRRVLDTLDLEANSIQRIADLRDVGGGLEVVLEPGQRELHGLAPTPAERVG